MFVSLLDLVLLSIIEAYGVEELTLFSLLVELGSLIESNGVEELVLFAENLVLFSLIEANAVPLSDFSLEVSVGCSVVLVSLLSSILLESLL